jgi:hypothetical protein
MEDGGRLAALESAARAQSRWSAELEFVASGDWGMTFQRRQLIFFIKQPIGGGIRDNWVVRTITAHGNDPNISEKICHTLFMLDLLPFSYSIISC